MNILQVSSLYPPQAVGGAERVAAAISAELTANGDQVTVVTTQNESGLTSEIKSGVHIYRYGLKNIYWPFDSKPRSTAKRMAWHLLDRSNPFMGYMFGKILDEVKPDVVITHNLQGWSCNVWEQARKRKIKVVHTLHDHSLICPRTSMHKAGINCEKPCFDCRCLSAKRVAHAEQLSGVMSVSNDLLQRHIAFGAISKKVPSRVVYNAVPRHFTILEDNRPLRSPELHIRIGFVGRVEASKGIEVLLAACQLLVDAGLEELFAVKIAGHCDKAYQNHLDDRWRRVGADYLGVTVASTFMDNIDVLVVPSLMSEGLGNVAFEGMARGTAVIASNIGGLREVLDNGNAGWLVTPGDPATLAAKLASLIMDRQLLARQSFAGLTRAAFFSLERQMSEIHDFLRSVCAAK